MKELTTAERRGMGASPAQQVEAGWRPSSSCFSPALFVLTGHALPHDDETSHTPVPLPAQVSR